MGLASGSTARPRSASSWEVLHRSSRVVVFIWTPQRLEKRGDLLVRGCDGSFLLDEQMPNGSAEAPCRRLRAMPGHLLAEPVTSSDLLPRRWLFVFAEVPSEKDVDVRALPPLLREGADPLQGTFQKPANPPLVECRSRRKKAAAGKAIEATGVL